MYVLSYDGYLEAVDAISGDLKWRFSTGPEHPLIGIAVADGVLYGVNGERVFALAADSPK
jgi:outer membrane protein assembly factor BamB